MHIMLSVSTSSISSDTSISILHDEDTQAGQVAVARHFTYLPKVMDLLGFQPGGAPASVAFTPSGLKSTVTSADMSLLEAALDQRHAKALCEWVATPTVRSTRSSSKPGFHCPRIAPVPSDLDNALRHRQRTVLHRVRRQLVDRHTKGQGGSRLQEHVWPLQDDIRATWRDKWL